MKRLGWNASDLARQANINEKTARKAIAQEPVSAATAQKIAVALTYHIQERILPGEIEGLVIE
jgi:plasmid maintenance system antidote protein VapI